MQAGGRWDGSNSDGRTVAEESIAVLDSVLIPNSWYTVTKNKNDGIYIREENLGIRLENDVVITEDGHHDLMRHIPLEADAIESAMTA